MVIELWGRDLAGRRRLFFDGAPLTRPLLLVLEGFVLLLVFDLSIAISLSSWSFAGAGICFLFLGKLLGQVPAVEGSLIQL